MEKLVYILLLITSQNLVGQSGNVLYGERNLESTASSLFFDKFGIIYPAYTISDSALKENNFSLSDWYSENKDQFISISKKYNCSFSSYSIENCNILNDSISSNFTKDVNKRSDFFQSVTFLIHGYRKSYISKNGDISSVQGFVNLKDSISKIKQNNTLYIEVYWDAMYDCCFSANSQNNKHLFQLFEEAQINATFTGNSLKKIVTSIKKSNIIFFSHSLGARVVVYSLLNIDNKINITPSNQQITICMIAPAISGNLITDFYYQRNSTVEFNKNDNYKLIIVYNENDFALRKKDDKFLLFGPGPYKYGNTSLGCNHKYSIPILEICFKVKYVNSSLKTFDVSSIGKKHHLENYCGSIEFESILKSIYQ